MRKFVLPFVAVLLLPACTLLGDTQPAATADDMNRLEIALRRLGMAVQGLLWSGAKEDADLIALACANDPTLCSPFGDNTLATSVIDGNAVLLLCTADKKRALVEDIACTPTPDVKAWAASNAPCAFTLPAQAIRDACR